MHGGNKQLTLTIQGSLTFNSDASYTYSFKARRNRSKIDKVFASGVTINNGAMIDLNGTTQGHLTEGLVLSHPHSRAVAVAHIHHEGYEEER